MSRASALQNRNRKNDPRVEEILRFKNDPLGFVAYCWQWGTGELKNERGPEPWQHDDLELTGKLCEENAFDGHTPVAPVRVATASGHGIGKTALVCWKTIWILGTRPFSNVTVTATTLPQLQQKTWSQLAKWVRLSLIADWFDYANSRGNMSLKVKGHEDEWFANAITCKEDNAEAFQGQHSPHSTSAYIIDEASGVPDTIWDAAEGGLTDGEPMIFAYGNPTRNVGRFCDLFGKLKHRWHTRQIDSRDVSRGNKALFQQWIDDWGEDSDFVRIRVKGQFPRVGSAQFISSDLVRASSMLVIDPKLYANAPKIIAVDVGAEGDDESVIVLRQGNYAEVLKRLRLGDDLMQLAAYVADEIDFNKPDAVFIDAIGVGAGPLSRLRQLGYSVIPVKGSQRATREGYYNMRSQMWGLMRDWLRDGGGIPKVPELERQLIAQEYGLSRNDLIQLVDKKTMKSDGLPSPDIGDALAFTFAHDVHVEDPLELFREALSDNQSWDWLRSANAWDPIGRA